MPDEKKTHDPRPCDECGTAEKCICMIIKCLVNAGGHRRGCCQDYIQASAPDGQIISQSDVGEKIHIPTTDASRGIVNNNGEFRVRRDGTYGVIAAPQAGRQGATGTPANFRCWLAVNGVPVPNSNVLMNMMPGGGGTKDVIVSQGFLELKDGDLVTVVMATDNEVAHVGTEAIQPTPNEPLVPGIIYSMWELCCDEKRTQGHGRGR